MILGALLHCLTLRAQVETQSSLELFKLEDNELIWQCVYDLSANADSLQKKVGELLKGKVYTRNVFRNELGFDGEIHYYQIDSKQYGRNFINTPKIYWEGNWFGKFFVEIKESKYRVTVYGLFYERKVTSTANTRQVETKKYNYAKHVLRDDGTFKRSERDNLLMMSLSLKDEFDLSNAWSPIRKDW